LSPITRAVMEVTTNFSRRLPTCKRLPRKSVTAAPTTSATHSTTGMPYSAVQPLSRLTCPP